MTPSVGWWLYLELRPRFVSTSSSSDILSQANVLIMDFPLGSKTVGYRVLFFHFLTLCLVVHDLVATHSDQEFAQLLDLFIILKESQQHHGTFLFILKVYWLTVGRVQCFVMFL